MTQKEVDVLFEITIMIHEHEYFGKRKKPKDREEAQKWVAKQLAENLEVYTTPCGMSWGVITTKERYDEYWKEEDFTNNYPKYWQLLKKKLIKRNK